MLDGLTARCEGVCVHCGPVDLAFRSHGGKRVLRCGVAVAQQRESPNRNSFWRTAVRSQGLTREEIARRREGKLCAICGAPAEVLDHYHKTGKVRDPLCNRHNVGLGFFSDSPEELEATAAHLRRWNEEGPAPSG